jgi:hypothetical protein
MIEFLLASTLSVSQANAIQKQESVNQACSYLIGIPYQSDNFSDNEWARFKYCRELLSETTK